MPASSTPAMMHNVALTLSAMRDHGINLVLADKHQLEAGDIVRGHRERTLALVWRLFGKWDLSYFVDMELLHNEVELLERLVSIPDDEDDFKVKPRIPHKPMAYIFRKCL